MTYCGKERPSLESWQALESWLPMPGTSEYAVRGWVLVMKQGSRRRFAVPGEERVQRSPVGR